MGNFGGGETWAGGQDNGRINATVGGTYDNGPTPGGASQHLRLGYKYLDTNAPETDIHIFIRFWILDTRGKKVAQYISDRFML